MALPVRSVVGGDEANMTEITRPLTRRALSSYRGRQLVVTLHPTWLAIRQSGRRSAFQIDYQAVYECAAKLKAREDRAEKMKAKKGAKR